MDDASAKIESGQNAITSASDQMSAGVDTLKEQKAKHCRAEDSAREYSCKLK